MDVIMKLRDVTVSVWKNTRGALKSVNEFIARYAKNHMIWFQWKEERAFMFEFSHGARLAWMESHLNLRWVSFLPLLPPKENEDRKKMNLNTTGNTEAESRALANLYYAFLDLEHLGVSNETIARTIKQSTRNSEKIAKLILEI